MSEVSKKIKKKRIPPFEGEWIKQQMPFKTDFMIHLLIKRLEEGEITVEKFAEEFVNSIDRNRETLKDIVKEKVKSIIEDKDYLTLEKDGDE